VFVSSVLFVDFILALFFNIVNGIFSFLYILFYNYLSFYLSLFILQFYCFM